MEKVHGTIFDPICASELCEFYITLCDVMLCYVMLCYDNLGKVRLG